MIPGCTQADCPVCRGQMVYVDKPCRAGVAPGTRVYKARPKSFADTVLLVLQMPPVRTLSLDQLRQAFGGEHSAEELAQGLAELVDDGDVTTWVEPEPDDAPALRLRDATLAFDHVDVMDGHAMSAAAFELHQARQAMLALGRRV